MAVIHPRNNEWNRKYNFTDESTTGYLIEIRNGMAFFAWETGDGELKYYKCEEDVFGKSFVVSADEASREKEIASMPPSSVIKRYPTEI